MRKLNFEKINFIFSAEKYSDWMYSHVQNPCPIEYEDRIRVFFNTRPKNNLKPTSHPTYIDLDKNNLNEILKIAKKPVLSLGERGCFDEFGCMASSVIKKHNALWMYYVGWQRLLSVPYNWAIGIAVSKNNGESFKRLYPGPVLGASKNESFLQNGCTIFENESDDYLHMFYSSGKKWFIDEEKPESQYLIMHAISKDGINWIREGKFIIPAIFEDETQTTPTVFFYNNNYHMIFSSRHSIGFRNKDRGYKLGYAYSYDLNRWYRDDHCLKISLSESGWDSEMICYPKIIKINQEIFLFYCGNYFGKGGFGYAILNNKKYKNK